MKMRIQCEKYLPHKLIVKYDLKDILTKEVKHVKFNRRKI